MGLVPAPGCLGNPLIDEDQHQDVFHGITSQEWGAGLAGMGASGCCGS